MDPQKRLPTSSHVTERLDLGKISFGDELIPPHHPRNREKLSNQQEIYKRKEKPNTRKELQNQKLNNAKGIHQKGKTKMTGKTSR